MKKLLSVVAIVAMLFAVSGVSFALQLPHEQGKVELTIPDTWKAEPQSADVLQVSSPDGDMSIVFMMLENNAADKVLDTIDTELEKSHGTITWNNDGKATEGEHNGMKYYEWAGVVEKDKTLVNAVTFDTPADKTLALYWFSSEAAAKKYEADTATIIKGIKPLAGSGSGAAAPAGSDAGAGSGSASASGS